MEILTKRNSGTIAKKRLQFLLISDRAGCTPEILEMIKDDMIKAISKYMEIDTDGLEIKITQICLLYTSSEKVLKFARETEAALKERFEEIDGVAEYNQLKVIKAMQEARVSDIPVSYTHLIIHEIEGLVADGVVEVMLLGQNVNSYGKTLEEPITFAELLRRVEQIDGLERIRFMTSHPKDLSDELIEVMKNSRKICKHLHLPVQSGSSRILKQMNRKYTKEQYLELVDKLRAAVPDISLTTDIIVGFPGAVSYTHLIDHFLGMLDP